MLIVAFFQGLGCRQLDQKNQVENILEHINDENNAQKTETFGFKSELAPPLYQGLLTFEKDLYKSARSIEFQNRSNLFQQKLTADVNSTRSTPNMLITVEKTNNLYKISTENYNKLLLDNVQKAGLYVSKKRFFLAVLFFWAESRRKKSF